MRSPGPGSGRTWSTYLHVVADKVLDMTVTFSREPVKVMDEICALGLRHVGYGTPIELFNPFVSACVEVVSTACLGSKTIESFRWSLGLVAKMMQRTITEGSTIVMKAINTNSVEQLREAIRCAPQGERAHWMLKVQVGTQSITPLYWSVRSGALESASVIICDCLTIRADRGKYYYAADELFERHSDIVKMLCDEAPGLLPTLLSGLIWRSRLTENGSRRVDYHVEHLLVSQDGQFSKALQWIAHCW